MASAILASRQSLRLAKLAAVPSRCRIAPTIRTRRCFRAKIASTKHHISLRTRKNELREMHCLGSKSGTSDVSCETITIVGGGRVGSALEEMCNGSVTVLQRGEKPSEDSSGPIIVCTRNDDLQGVVDATPAGRLEDLVFIQNGMLQPWLEEKGLGKNTQALVYFAVSKKGEKPVDGVTKLNPEGLTAVTGKHSDIFSSILKSGGLTCKVLDEERFKQSMLEKLIWICTMMLIGARHNVSVGEVASAYKSEVVTLAEELAATGAAELGISLETGLVDRLCSYSDSVGHFPTAVKEFKWRNGWFYDISTKALASGNSDPCPTHSEWLREVGAV